jgi:hypothetical protein
LNKKDGYSSTTKHGAAESGHGEVVWLLLEKGTEVETRERLRRTALRERLPLMQLVDPCKDFLRRYVNNLKKEGSWIMKLQRLD